ncbi:MAG: FtsW/RodA/SpoVE family cell cycle protein [Mariniphaga sp.]|nr:FtsW/RodA/SpoVE family cell cycle protein [Mariniphaga sp.]
MKARNNILLNLDWITVFLYLVLVMLGWVNIYAAVYSDEHQSIMDIGQRYGKQLIWIIAGIILAIMVLTIDSKFFAAFATHIYIFTILLLVAVLIFGKEVNGARAWFEFGSVALQPAELGKFATNLAIAKCISQFDFKIQKLRSYLTLSAIIALPAILIIMQNDTGSALVFAVFILVFFREGLSGMVLFWGFAAAALFVLSLLLDEFKLLIFLLSISVATYGVLRLSIKEALIGLFAIVGTFGLIWLIDVLFGLGGSPFQLLLITTAIIAVLFIAFGIFYHVKQVWRIVLFFIFAVSISMSVNYFYKNVLIIHQRNRIDEVLGIKTDKLGAGYNVNQSKIAIGSGGITGKGFLNGTQTKYNFVPEQSTDFIFCTVGEEWGFLGSTFVVGLFLILLIRLITIAERQRSQFSRVYGYGVACILFFHIAINISMTIGLAPVIGIPLPFFSYGGSSLWAFTILLFIFLRLDASRTENLR